ncbi:MAG: HAMP domain-containing sensor histidine kinase [Candidatus Promineifilaceae bacterium]
MLVIEGIRHIISIGLPFDLILLAALGIIAHITAVFTLAGVGYSVASTISVAAIPFYGPLGGALVAMTAELGLWVFDVQKTRPPWTQALRRLGFNIGANGLSIYLAGIVFESLVPALHTTLVLDYILAWGVMIIIADQLNFWLIIFVVHLQKHVPPLAIWDEQKWAIPMNIAVTSLGGGLLALAILSSGALGIAIFFVPILLSAFSFRLYVRRTNEEKKKLEEMVRVRTQDLANVNERLASANEELAALHEEKDAFLTVLSHDMRSPLTSIHGYISMLLGRPDTNPQEQEHILEIVLANEQALLEIVNNILEVRQLQMGGTIILERQPVNIGLLAIEIVESTRPQAAEKGIQLSYEVNTDGDLQRYFATVDREKIKRVIQNLVSNAVKYTPPDGCVVLRVFGSKKDILIEVEDTGYGIPKEDLPRIFESFHRVRTHQTLAAGTGLGLSIVQMLLEAHNGNIVVESEVGKGSKFSVTLPK